MGPLSQASNALRTYTKHHIEDPQTSLSAPDTYSDHTFILSLDYGLLEFLPCPDRFDGMPTQERLEHYLKKTDPLPLLVRPGELIWLDGSLPPGSGCGRWDWLHRVVPTNEFFEFEGRQYQTQHRISLVFGR